MPRVKRGISSHKRHANLLELAKGYRNGRRKLVKRAREAVLKAGQNAYNDRRNKKRDLRGEWIIRINAATRKEGMNYSTFMSGLKKANININRKVLAEMAVNDEAALNALIKKAKTK